MRLIDSFIEPVTYVLDVVRKPQDFPDYAATRAKVEDLLNGAGRMAKVLGVAAQEFQDARFAVCAWMDEAVLGSAWDGKALWLHQPLQRVVYGTVNAGDECFERLEALLAKTRSDGAPLVPGELTSVDDLSFGLEEEQPEGSCPQSPLPEISAKPAVFEKAPAESDTGIGLKGVLEVFALVLMLGFTGRYFHPDDRPALKLLRQRALDAALASGPGYGKVAGGVLFPGLYSEPVNHGLRRRFWRGLDWADMVVLGLPVLAVTVLFYAYTFILSGELAGFLGGK